jgi:hypothetical protein
MTNNCPICNKAGLPDYTSTQTVCPQCNSDLRPFLLLNSIAKSNFKKQLFFGIIGTGVILVVFALLYFNSLSENNKIQSDNANRVQTLQDSLQTLHTLISVNPTNVSESETAKKEIIIQYKVKSGDYTSKIAHFFYNDWQMYKQIEADNNLIQPYILKVGQTLNIKIKQQ